VIENSISPSSKINDVIYDGVQVLNILKEFKNQKVSTADPIKMKSVNLLKVLTMQSKVYAISSLIKSLKSKVTLDAKLSLKNLVRESLHPLNLSIQQSFKFKTFHPFVMSPSHALPEISQYNITSSRPNSALYFSFLNSFFVRAVKNKFSTESKSESFLIFQTHKGKIRSDMESYAINAISALRQLLLTLQKSFPIVRSIEGVEFTGINDSVVIAYEWSNSWKTFDDIINQHGGLLHRGYYELFRILATRLLDVLIELSHERIVVHSLSPSTVIVDQSGNEIRLLLLPTASRSEDCNHEFIDSYTAYVQNNQVEGSCIPVARDEESKYNSSWDVWSYGMCIYALAFGEPFLSHGSNDDSHSQNDDDYFIDDLVRGFYSLHSKNKTSQESSSAESMGDHEAHIMNLISSSSSDLLFKIFELKMGKSLHHLQKFRDNFTSLGKFKTKNHSLLILY